MPKAVPESLGLYRVRLHPSGTPDGTDGWWEVDATDQSALAAAADMVTRLDLSGWPALDRMMTSGGMLEQVRRGDFGDMKRGNFGVYFARAEALLLMDTVRARRWTSDSTTRWSTSSHSSGRTRRSSTSGYGHRRKRRARERADVPLACR